MILAIIPARAGSKGLPRKNIRPLLGKPLIQWSIESALSSKLIDRVLVSTDSEEISNIALSCGAEIQDRPSYLADDMAKTIDVLKYILTTEPDTETIVTLQPTSPLRYPGLIDECITEYLDGEFDNLATGFWCKNKEFSSHNNQRRQDYQGFFYDDGNIYILSHSVVKKGKWFGEKICKKVIEKPMNYEIDDEVDWHILEELIRQYGKI